MKKIILESENIVLRPFTLTDADRVQQLAGEKEISDTTLLIPHPYPDGAAEEWISRHAKEFEEKNIYNFAVTVDDKVVGSIGFGVNLQHNNCEVGYWIGKPYWGKGYASKALGLIIKFCFEELELNKVHAHYMKCNWSSGRVMEKNGMKQEGILRKHVMKNGAYHDIVTYGILKNEYENEKGSEVYK